MRHDLGIRAMDKWAVARLFMMPFAVSSFAALIKDHGFFVVFSPRLAENAVAGEIVGLERGEIGAAKQDATGGGNKLRQRTQHRGIGRAHV